MIYKCVFPFMYSFAKTLIELNIYKRHILGNLWNKTLAKIILCCALFFSCWILFRKRQTVSVHFLWFQRLCNRVCNNDKNMNNTDYISKVFWYLKAFWHIYIKLWKQYTVVCVEKTCLLYFIFDINKTC